MRLTLDRVANRAKREAIAKFPPAHRWAASRHRAALDAYRSHLPAVDEVQQAQLRSLHDEGVLVQAWDAFEQPGVEELKPLLAALADDLARRPAWSEGSDSTVRVSRDDMLDDVRLFQWGLQDELLALAENRFGSPAYYYGPLVHRELADSCVVSTRQWHRDIEDRSVLKLIVYLVDVDVDGGPFTYASLEDSRGAARTLRYVGGFIPDAKFATVVPPQRWGQAVGPRWTAAMPDTAAIFHRAQAPVLRDRYSVTFTWTSRSPSAVIRGEPWRPDQARRATRGLAGRQFDSLAPQVRAAIR